MRIKIKPGLILIAAMTLGASVLAGGVALPAQADFAPGPSDIVGIGSDTPQYLMDFGDDGDPEGDAGFNTAGAAYKVVNFDATADSNGRTAYLNNSTSASARPLTPTDVLRAGTYPVQRVSSTTAGINALLADTSPASPSVDFVVTTSLPTSAQISQAEANGWGGLEVASLGDEELEIVADQAATNAPAGLSAEQLVAIYQCQDTQWTQVGGTSSDTIIPVIPPPGSDSRSIFLADLQAANGGTPIALGSCVTTASSDDDPTAITANSDPADVIEPFDSNALNLWSGVSGDTDIAPDSGTGYFRNPTVAYPGGSVLSPGVTPLDGAPSDGNENYVDIHGLYVVYRASDQTSTTPWEPGSTLNWAQTLFCNPGGATPFFATPAGQVLASQSGAAPAYFCGNAANANLAANCKGLDIWGPKFAGTTLIFTAVCGTPNYTWVNPPNCNPAIPAANWSVNAAPGDQLTLQLNGLPASTVFKCMLSVSDSAIPQQTKLATLIFGTR